MQRASSKLLNVYIFISFRFIFFCCCCCCCFLSVEWAEPRQRLFLSLLYHVYSLTVNGFSLLESWWWWWRSPLNIIIDDDDDVVVLPLLSFSFYFTKFVWLKQKILLYRQCMHTPATVVQNFFFHLILLLFCCVSYHFILYFVLYEVSFYFLRLFAYLIQHIFFAHEIYNIEFNLDMNSQCCLTSISCVLSALAVVRLMVSDALHNSSFSTPPWANKFYLLLQLKHAFIIISNQQQQQSWKYWLRTS